MDVKAGKFPNMIRISSMYFKPSVYGEPATYSGQTRYLMKNKLITNKHPDTEAQIEMVGRCSTNAT